MTQTANLKTCKDKNKNKQTIVDIKLPDHEFYEFCPVDSTAVGGTLLYIENHLSYKLRKNLSIYKSCELGSIFIEISSPKKTNIVTGCKHKPLKIYFN